MPIPITFVGGSGGHFVCHLLNAAFTNNQSTVSLSKNGDAHNSQLGFCIGGGIFDDGTSEILAYANSNEKRNKFVAMHCSDFEFLRTSFQKMIVITYAKQNIEEIATVFANKWRRKNETEHNHTKEKEGAMLAHISVSSIFTDTLLSSERVMNLSWDNLFRGDVNEVVLSLSTFTQIPITNFNIPNLIYWRKLTNDGLTNCEK